MVDGECQGNVTAPPYCDSGGASACLPNGTGGEQTRRHRSRALPEDLQSSTRKTPPQHNMPLSPGRIHPPRARKQLSAKGLYASSLASQDGASSPPSPPLSGDPREESSVNLEISEHLGRCTAAAKLVQCEVRMGGSR